MMPNLFEDSAPVQGQPLQESLDIDAGPVMYRAIIIGNGRSEIAAEGDIKRMHAFWSPGDDWRWVYSASAVLSGNWARTLPDGSTEWCTIKECGQ